MAEEEELDIELNDAADKDHEVEEINLDDVKDAGLDDFLKEVDSKEDLPDINYQDEVAHTSYSDDVAALSEATEADFANLNLNDFNAALDSYKAARSGKCRRHQLLRTMLRKLMCRQITVLRQKTKNR